MSFRQLARLSALLATLVVVFSRPGIARADSWQICNGTADVVKVAIAYNLKDQRQYISNGWWSLPSHGGCKTVLSGILPVRGVFLRGESPHGTWEGDMLFCVLPRGELPGANQLDDKQCAARGGSMRRFELHILSSTQQVTTVENSTMPHPPAGFGNDVQSCAVDAPCFQSAYQSGRNVVFEFNGVTGWDAYNVRLPDGEQFENHSGKFTLHDVQPHSTYQISVQGCHKHFLAHSTCSAWISQKFTTD